MIKKQITWIKEKNKKKNFLKNYFLKSTILQQNSMYTYYTPTHKLNSTKKIRQKNICLRRGKYNNNFSIFKFSRHYIKYLLTWKLITIDTKKW